MYIHTTYLGRLPTLANTDITTLPYSLPMAMPSLGISLFFLFSLLPFESYAYSILINYNNNNKENVGHKVVYT